MLAWCLSGARCRLAYGPADATVTHCHCHSLVLPFLYLLTRVVPDKGPLNGRMRSTVILPNSHRRRRRDQTVSSRRRRRCELGISVACSSCAVILTAHYTLEVCRSVGLWEPMGLCMICRPRIHGLCHAGENNQSRSDHVLCPRHAAFRSADNAHTRCTEQ